MGFAEIGEQLWREMQISEREDFLGQLATVTHRHSAWWGGMTVADIARIPSFDDLPGDLRGLLMLSMTDRGFLIEKFIAARKIMIDVANPVR